MSTRVAVAALLVLLLTTSRVAAASLGGVTGQTLGSFAFTTSTGAPVVVAWENFNAANGTAIPGTTTDGGGLVWSAPRCTWTTQGNRADTTSGDCPLLVNSGSAHRAVEATVIRGGATFDVGLMVNSNTAATQFLTVEWTSTSNGSLELWKYDGSWVALGSVTNLYPGGIATAPTSIVLRLELTSASVLQASIGGVPVVSATLSAADQALFDNATHTSHGLYAYLDGASRWDDVHLDTTT